MLVGWVAYAVSAVVSAVGENKLMAAADCACKVINGNNGFVRDNTSWIIGRLVRDFESWKHPSAQQCVEHLIREQWKITQAKAPGGRVVPRPIRGGLCISVYRAKEAKPGHPGRDLPYYTGFLTSILQLAFAAIPIGLFGDWGIMLVTAAGIILSFASGSLPQWKSEKWACRGNATKTVVLTKGNGSQHAIVIIGDGKGLDLEDLAAAGTIMPPPSGHVKLTTMLLAVLWTLLLVTASGIKENTWFLLLVGGVGMLQNIYAAGVSRRPEDYGVPLEFVEVIGNPKAMQALFTLEENYPSVGRSLLTTFFPADLRRDEKQRWNEYYERAIRLKDEVDDLCRVT